jgi:hypothetical protein
VKKRDHVLGLPDGDGHDAAAGSRSLMGRISEENPDLPISFIKDILIGRVQMQKGNKGPYAFGEDR